MTTLKQLLEQWAFQSPTHEALLGLDRSPLTFGHMVEQLQALRAAFCQLGLGRDTRLALLAPNGPDLALAFLACATSASCAPLNPAYRREEVAFYLDDLEASALLIAGTLESPAREVAHARGIPILELHSLIPDYPAGCFVLEGRTGLPAVAEQATTPEDIALILHTSGTTARPKQVPLTQANLCASIRHLQRSLALTPQDRCLNLMPLFHIHGLVGALLAALGSGGSVICPPGFSSVDVFDWLDTFEPTWYTAVPTIHQAMLAQARREPTRRLNQRVRFIRSSSASLPPTVMAELEQVFGVPVIEAYGMTEAAHQMTSNPLPPGVRKSGSVGLPAGPEIRILSVGGEVLPVGEIGEVAIKGPNVMAGYCQNPDANAQAFTRGWFRTGDQGYLDPDGYLFLTGRLKELINRGGEKIAPLEIDQALLSHPAIQQAVTFAMPHPTLGEEVAAAVVLQEQAIVTEAELQNFLTQSLAEFKIPRRIVITSEIPKGPTGKLQRIGLSEKLLDGLHDSQKTGEAPSRSVLEQQIAWLWSSILGQEDIGLHESFLQLGGDSISGGQLRSRIRDLFQVELSWLQLFQETNTVAGLAALIQNHLPENGSSPIPPLVALPDQRRLPLAFAQEPLWLATQFNTGNTAYNRSLILRLEGHLHMQALERSLNEIVRRHEALRTTFPLDAEGPRQMVNPVGIHTLECREFPHSPKDNVEETFNALVVREVATPFDLIQGPVIRFIIFRVTELDHRLVVILHHLVSDGWSDGVFFQELESLYNRFCQGESSCLPELSIQYGDFVWWQQQWLTGKTLASQLEYWKKQLGDGRSFQVLQGIKGPSNRTGKTSRREQVMLSRLQTDSLKAFSRQESVTPFTILLAGFFILLHRWTQKDEITIGVPVANRIHPLLEPLIGLLANTLPLRSNIQWAQSSRAFLQQLHGTGLTAFSHADLPLQELRQALGPAEIFTGISLFQILFVFENAPQYLPRLKDLTSQQMNLPVEGPALVDLSFFLWDQPQGIQGYMVFDQEVFSGKMIQGLIRNYYSILEWMMKSPNSPLRSLQLDFSHMDDPFQEKGSQHVRSQEKERLHEADSGEINSTISTGGVDSSAMRRGNLQERVAKLSKSQQKLFNKKLKQFRDPPST
ncbi:MAG TPA: AMP-binding protein [Nitrospirales bacterium]|nr:hypothetical protein [Nitrospiraceae bacterium]HNP27630.1 AMP-binding protein [Nitrospirales bacterium]